MKILMLIENESNQKALANKIHAHYPISGIITESRKHRKNFTFTKIYEKIFEKIFLSDYIYSWITMLRDYDKYFPDFPQVPTVHVENINDDAAYSFMNMVKPDLIMVSGTRLLKERILSLKCSVGIINLHTGLSPYVKGGPNCTNWCIATDQLHLIGNTVMWIDHGIDSGNIIASENTCFSGNEGLSDVHIRVMDHGHHLYLEVVKHLSEGLRSNVPQENIGMGSVFYSKDWTLKQKIALIRNFKSFKYKINSKELKLLISKIITVNIR